MWKQASINDPELFRSWGPSLKSPNVFPSGKNTIVPFFIIPQYFETIIAREHFCPHFVKTKMMNVRKSWFFGQNCWTSEDLDSLVKFGPFQKGVKNREKILAISKKLTANFAIFVYWSHDFPEGWKKKNLPQSPRSMLYLGVSCIPQFDFQTEHGCNPPFSTLSWGWGGHRKRDFQGEILLLQ